jgi:TDG/mug DNA glycosylase family protein
MTQSGHVLPDVLAPGLRIVFCGTAAGTVSARRGTYYAHAQNKFWRTLFEVGLTPRLLRPEEYGLLPQWGLGLTDLAKHVSGMDYQLPRGSLGDEACAALTAKVREMQPKLLAFTSLAGGRRFLGRVAGFGDSGAQIDETRIWLLPSPSPAAHWNWDLAWWRRLAEAANP